MARQRGSKDNITRWDATLKTAVDEAKALRAKIWNKRGKATSIRAENRLLIVGKSGQAISGRTWQNAWRRFLELDIEEGIMTKDEWFGLHDMKRRGTTDTLRTKVEKLEATGLSERVLPVYDKSVPIVDPAPD